MVQYMNLAKALPQLYRPSFLWTARTSGTCISISFISGIPLLLFLAVRSRMCATCFACIHSEAQSLWTRHRLPLQNTRQSRWLRSGQTKQSFQTAKRCGHCTSKAWRSAVGTASTSCSGVINGLQVNQFIRPSSFLKLGIWSRHSYVYLFDRLAERSGSQVWW